MVCDNHRIGDRKVYSSALNGPADWEDKICSGQSSMSFEVRNHQFKYKVKKRGTIHVKSKCCGFTLKAVDILSHCLNNIRNVGVRLEYKGPLWINR